MYISVSIGFLCMLCLYGSYLYDKYFPYGNNKLACRGYLYLLYVENFEEFYLTKGSVINIIICRCLDCPCMQQYAQCGHCFRCSNL